MSLAEEMRHREPDIERGIAEVHDFVVEQNQSALVNERVFGTEIAMNQAVFMS